MRRFIQKRRIMLYPLFLLTTSCTSKPDEQVKAYQEAHNSGDVEKEVSFYAEDVKFVVFGQWTIKGKEELRKLVETDAVLNSHLIFTDVKVDGNRVTCSVEEQNDLLKLAGIDTLYYEFHEFIFEKGLIKEVRAKPTPESAKALQEFGASFGRWASENRSQEFAELKGESVITKENVGKWLTLMREWREAMEKEKK